MPNAGKLERDLSQNRRHTPIEFGSVLYRILQLVADNVAERLRHQNQEQIERSGQPADEPKGQSAR